MILLFYPILLFSYLTHCSLVMPYGKIYMDNIGSANGLLPNGTKPLPEPMLTNHEWGLCQSPEDYFT